MMMIMHAQVNHPAQRLPRGRRVILHAMPRAYALRATKLCASKLVCVSRLKCGFPCCCQVELTENAIPTMWSGANNEMAYTVQILKYIHMGEGKGYKIHVSDGKTFTLLLINSKPEIAEMIVEKGEGLINSIGLIEVKSSPHPKNAGQKLLFLQTLKILQEGVEKIGEPVKFESENQAKKDTDTPKQVYSCFSLPLNGYLACLSLAELATILIYFN